MAVPVAATVAATLGVATVVIVDAFETTVLTLDAALVVVEGAGAVVEEASGGKQDVKSKKGSFSGRLKSASTFE